MQLTPDLLLKATRCSLADAERFAGPLSAACQAYDINTPARLAAFLAQIGHESGSLRYTSEIWGPTPAQLRYEGRTDLGNLRPGDGPTYRGHGLIQVTGRANHAAARDRMRARFGALHIPDFEASPELLMDAKWAALSAADYWDSRKLNKLADAGDFEAITRAINGGLNGQTDRAARWSEIKQALAAAQQAPAAAPTTPPTVIIEPAQPAPKETRMLPAALLLNFLPSLIQQIPELVKAFRPGDEKTQKYADTAVKVFDIAKTAVGAVNEQEVIEKLTSDPAAVTAARSAIQAQWFDIQEAGGGGIEGARKQDAIYVTGQAVFWRSPSFIVTCLLVPLVYFIMGAVVGLYGKLNLSAEVTASIITGIVTLIIGGAAGYYYGSTTGKNTPAQPSQ